MLYLQFKTKRRKSKKYKDYSFKLENYENRGLFSMKAVFYQSTSPNSNKPRETYLLLIYPVKGAVVYIVVLKYSVKGGVVYPLVLNCSVKGGIGITEKGGENFKAIQTRSHSLCSF